MASIDDKALDKVRVLDDALPQQQIVLAHRHTLTPRLHCNYKNNNNNK